MTAVDFYLSTLRIQSVFQDNFFARVFRKGGISGVVRFQSPTIFPITVRIRIGARWNKK
jgi:hypothetical protein